MGGVDPSLVSSSSISFEISVELFLLVSPSRQMNAKLRPSFSQIVLELERRQAERKQKDETTVKGESSNTERLNRFYSCKLI